MRPGYLKVAGGVRNTKARKAHALRAFPFAPEPAGTRAAGLARGNVSPQAAELVSERHPPSAPAGVSPMGEPTPEPHSGRQANRPRGGFFVSQNERAAVKQFVYVMKSISGLVKIGVSARPDVRRAALETGSGFSVSIVETFGPFNRATAIESAAHDSLSSRRQCGEWFDCEASAATDAVRRAIDGFVDAPDGDPAKEQAAIEELAKWAASGIVRPVEQFADAAQEVLCRYENLSGRYVELTDQFVEACELVEFYSDHAKHAVFIAQKSMDQIKRLEGELSALKAAGCAATQ